MITNGNFKRDESVLILPHNTLRFVDVIKELEIRRMKNWPQLDFEVQLFESVHRKAEYLEDVYKLNEESRQILKDKWLDYYELAPRTNFYEYLDIMIHQKFIKKAMVLFDCKNDSIVDIEEDFENIYYDGRIEELERIINDKGVTCLVLHSIDLLKTLSDRGNIDLNDMTILISETGYNMVVDTEANVLVSKPELEEVNKKYTIEPVMVKLFDFDQETFDKVKVHREKMKRIIQTRKDQKENE